MRSRQATLNGVLLALALAASPALAQSQHDGSPAGSAVARYLAGRIAQNAGDWDLASANLAVALRQDPENASLLRRTFLLSLGEGKQAESVALGRRLAETGQGSFVAHALLVADALRNGRLDEAQAHMDRLPADGMAPYISPLLSAWVAVEGKRFDDAVTALEPLATHQGFDGIRTLQLALIEDIRGDKEAAFRHYTAAAKHGGALRVTLLIGNFQERAGAVQAARTLYRSYLAANPGSMMVEEALARLEEKPGRAITAPPRLVANARQGLGEALFGLAAALQQEGALEMALLYGRVALHLDSGQPLARLLVGDLLNSRNRGETALEEYQAVRAGQGAAAHWMARMRQVEVLTKLDRSAEAVALLDRLAAERPDRTDALLRLGDIHRIAKRGDAALAAYDRALARVKTPGPAHWPLVYARAMVLDAQGDWPAAEKGLRQALELHPDQPGVLNYLGYSYIDREERLEEGKALIEKALGLRPQDGFITDSLGWALFRMGRLEEAVELLEKAVELEPGDPEINDHLGDAYWAVGRLDEARFQWTRAAHQTDSDGLRRAAQSKLRNGLVNTVKADNTGP